MITLYHHPLSGHCHRVRLFLSLIGQPFQLVEVDLLAGAQKAPDFLARNAFGQVPVIDDGGTVVADSNAVLVYLALAHAPEGWLPTDPQGAAAVQRWLSVAAGPINSGPGAARLVKVFGAPLDHGRAKSVAEGLFAVMEPYLANSQFLAGGRPTIADIANYSYIALASEGDISLEPYPNIRAWLARIEALPGFVPTPTAPVA